MKDKPIRNFAKGLEWLRRESNGIVAVLLTPDQCLFSVDPAISPRDLEMLLVNEAPHIAAHEAKRRKHETRK